MSQPIYLIATRKYWKYENLLIIIMDQHIKSIDFEKHFKTSNILIDVVKFVIV